MIVEFQWQWWWSKEWEKDWTDVFPDSSVTNLAPLFRWLDLTLDGGGLTSPDNIGLLDNDFSILLLTNFAQYNCIANHNHCGTMDCFQNHCRIIHLASFVHTLNFCNAVSSVVTIICCLTPVIIIWFTIVCNNCEMFQLFFFPPVFATFATLTYFDKTAGIFHIHRDPVYRMHQSTKHCDDCDDCRKKVNISKHLESRSELCRADS